MAGASVSEQVSAGEGKDGAVRSGRTLMLTSGKWGAVALGGGVAGEITMMPVKA